MIVDRYYYHQLNKQDQAVYRAFYDGIMAYQDIIPMRMIASHNIFGVFAYHRAQCEGIAKAVKVLLNAVDVRCIVVTGESVKNGKKVPHAWNMVKIDRQPYHLDVTWDIGAIGSSFKRISYDYFNLSDQLIIKEHKADTQLPSCSSMQHNYFKANKRTFWMKSQAMAYVKKALQGGDTEFYFRMEGRNVASDVAEKIYNQICVFISEKGVTDKRVKHIANDKIGTCWIKIY